MNVPLLIANSIRHSAREVFSTMLSVDLSLEQAGMEPASAAPGDGVVSFIGLAGAWVGTGSLICSPTLACRICSALLQAPAASVDEEVLDAVAELTNMIIGGVKNDLELELGPMGLSIPTVIFGRNFKTKSASNAEWVVERFGWEGEILQVKLGMAPNKKAVPAGPHAGSQTCPLEVNPLG